MIPKKNNFIQWHLIVYLIFIGIESIKSEYCKSDNKFPLDVKPVTSDDWNIFFQNLFVKLSAYDVQKDTSKYNVKDISDWGKIEKPQGLEVTEENLEPFFKRILESFNISRPSYLNNKSLSLDQMEKLKNILDLTLKTNVSINCSKEDVLVTGNFVSLKNAQGLYENHRNVNPFCEKEALKEKQSIKVFASNTIFIDTDVERYLFPSLTKMLPLIFIAPKWEIIGNRKINLNGTNRDDNFENITGLDLRPYSARANEERIIDKEKYLFDGVQKVYKKYMINGTAGLPGKPGGTFIGISGKFIGAKNLVISVVGGVGSNGRDGESSRKVDRFIYQNITECGNCLSKNHDICVQIIENDIEIGGYGGKGGSGGPSGNITLIELNSNLTDVNMITGVGKDGQHGKGKNVGHRNINWHLDPSKCYLNKSFQRIEFFNERVNYLWRGPFRIDGVNELPDNVKSQLVFDKVNISDAKIVKEYQDYFRRNFKVSLKDFLDLDFIDKLNENTIERNLLTAHDLYEESKELENEFFRAENKNDLHAFYELLLNKVYAYARNKKIPADDDEYKLVKYLYTAVLSRKNYLKENPKTGPVISVSQVFENLKDELTENSQKFVKTEILENLRKRTDDYQKKIVEESEKAKSTTQSEVKRDLVIIGKAIDKSMDALLMEIKKKENETMENGSELADAQSKLIKDLLKKCAFSVVKLLNAGLACAGPKGAIASAIFGVGIDVSETFETGSMEERRKKVSKIGQDLKSAAEEVTKQAEVIEKLKKTGKVQKQRYFLKLALNESDGIMKLSWRTFTIEDIDKMSDEDVESKHDEIRVDVEKKKLNMTKVEKLDKFIKKYDKLISQVPDTAGTIIFSVLDYYSEDKRLENLIAANAKELEKLKDLETNVFPVLLEEMKKLVRQIENLGKNVGKISKVDFDTSRKNVEFVLDETERNLKIVFGKFDATDQLIFTIEKLKKELSYSFISNNVIKDFQEQQILFDMLENLNSNSVLATSEESDPKIIELDALVHSNIVLKKYQLAYQALELYVFPFADTFLKDLRVPEELSLTAGNDIVNAVSEVRKQVTMIHTKIKGYTGNYGMVEGYFVTRPTNSSRPFFVWRNEENKDTIFKLLSGKEVYLYADVTKASSQEWDAVKMKRVELDIVSNHKPKKFRNILNFFRIELTHLGDNHYRLNDKIYTAQSVETPIKLTFDEIEPDEPVLQTTSNVKLKDSEFLLSPYATWKVQLNPTGSDKLFKNLTRYADHVDLELTGIGSYVERRYGYDKVPHYDYKTMQSCDIM